MSSSRAELPKGIHRQVKLPDPALSDLWGSIIVDKKLKDQLLAQALVNFTVRPKVSRSVLPLHGTILLVGPPGTGKTSLAKGLASETAKVFNKSEFPLLEIDPHALGSAMMGKTQKAVSDLFSQTIAEAALTGPTIVLLDEVETLAADRSKLSLQANRSMSIERPTQCWCSWMHWLKPITTFCSSRPATSLKRSIQLLHPVATSFWRYRCPLAMLAPRSSHLAWRAWRRRIGRSAI